MSEKIEIDKATATILNVEGLTKTFDNRKVVAVDNVSFSVNQGEILAILGPSGCGKTTMMRIIAGLEFPDSGRLRVNGKSVLDLPAYRRNIGLVFQDLAIFPHMTVFENVAFGLRMKKHKRLDIKRRVHKLLEMVELPPVEFADRSSRMLSGGEKQRVAVARTLAMRPSIVLMDEPMASLDRKLRERMTVELRRLLKRLETTVLYVTHDQESASFFSDRILVMSNGRFIQSGSPMDIYRRPNSRFVADFIGTMNFIDARVTKSDASGILVRFGDCEMYLPNQTYEAGNQVTLGIRPEDLWISWERAEHSLAKGRLVGWNFFNGTFHYQMLLPEGTELTISEPSGEYAKATGRDVWVEAQPGSIIPLKE